ncbi:MAG TPA: hypothetical protein VN515_01400 [Terriglobales bacterium]|nr:hypothetical protein [Terriglobales bacterium]
MIQLEPVHSFPIEEYLLTRMAFSPDGAAIAVGHKHFRAYSAESGEPRAEYPFTEFLARICYSPDGRFVAGANVADNHPATRGKLTVFAAGNGREVFSAAAEQPIEALAFASGGAIYWNAQTMLAGARIEPHTELPSVALRDLQLRGLACSSTGFTCFGREAAGSVQMVEGADLIFRKFRLRSLDPQGAPKNDIDLGIGAGVHALSPDGKLLAVEMVDFKNNERHVSLIDVETGVEANLLPLEANTLPVFEFGLGSEYFLCMKEDAEDNFNRLRIWRTSDLKLVGEAQVDLAFHSLACRLEHSLVAFLGGGKLGVFALS